MDLRLLTLLGLTLQALSGVHLQDSGELATIQPEFAENPNDTDLDSTANSSGDDSGPLDENLSNNGTANDITLTETMPVENTSMPTNGGVAPPANGQNATDSLPASPSNGTARDPTATLPDIPLNATNLPTDTGIAMGNHSKLPNASHPTQLSPPDPIPDDSANNGTADEHNSTAKDPFVPAATENVPRPPQATSRPNTTTTTTTTTTTPTSNNTIKAGASGNNTDRGFLSNTEKRKNGNAWAAIIGTALAVGFVGLVIYVLLKKKNRREFMHRKLIEDIPPEPVLRLDNSEPLDLKYDGSAYYNPGLQGDNIQMTNFPQGHMH
ncbi:hypothetical protein AAFF_G00040580 [Aldrovandia affinis]|uniref:Mucin-15 n=1 Tax=Aldrovandia affinis TaxID=143900 RepID=A0AAD7WFQ9_9TELE|nr:hypothetical protein AAFF_G00040580 [Aldrovandia affinis]